MSDPKSIDPLRRDADDVVARAKGLYQSSGLGTTEASSLSLAHYTSLEAIVSMLQNPDGGLRLSDSSTMNDPEEGRATKDDRLVLNFLEDEVGKDSWIWERYSVANICCFVGVGRGGDQVIDAGDDLLFWRLYGNDCRGVSISMAPHVCKKLVESSCVQRVVYTDEPPLQIDLRAVSSLLTDLDELRRRARDAERWPEIGPLVLSACDLLFKQRFLRKRSHYEMEREYRAVVFCSEEDDEGFGCARGRHVQYGRIRTYVELLALKCASIFTTSSQITIGSNVAEASRVKDNLTSLLDARGVAPGVVSIRVSDISYRPR